MNTKASILLLAAGLCATSTLQAQKIKGTRALPILEYAQSAQTAALGGNHYGESDVSHLYTNPTSLLYGETVLSLGGGLRTLGQGQGDVLVVDGGDGPHGGGEQNSAPNSISVSDVVLYPAKRQATIREEPLELTSTEFNLLEVLMRHAGQVVSKETLSIEALDRKLAKFDRSIDVHISSIRHKLGDASLIQTVRGLGYLFVKN